MNIEDRYVNKTVKTSWLVIDSEFNRAWNASLIGHTFTSPPSYTMVEQTTAPAEYESIKDFPPSLRACDGQRT